MVGRNILKRIVAASFSTLIIAGAGLVSAPASSWASDSSFDCDELLPTFQLTLSVGEVRTVTFENCESALLVEPLSTQITWTPANNNGQLGICGAPGITGSCLGSGTSFWDYQAKPSPSITFYAPEDPQDFTTELKLQNTTSQNFKTNLDIKVEAALDLGNNGSTSGSQSGSSAPTLDLTLDPTETDATCSVAGISGARGSWVTLEAASDCTPPPSTPDATLLGWATDPDFPVDIAQRQVNNGWGAYETYNDDGQLTGVFIPAGGAASLTNSNTLHAIWSDTTNGS